VTSANIPVATAEVSPVTISSGSEVVDVLVIGAGPAGLSAARALSRQGVGSVLVVDREKTPGGIPRHSDHTGYGLRDVHRVMRGPAYAHLLAEQAQHSGAHILSSTMVTGWVGERSVRLTSPQGIRTIDARAVLLATGARERPRAARLVPGDRPAGVLTTGQLQSMVHLHHQWVGERAVIVGSELVSWSAVLTLREAGCRTVLMTSTHPRLESPWAFTVPGRLALGVAVARHTQVTGVLGDGRVRGVEIQNLATGRRQTIDCDTVVFTGDWIPDSELARSAGLAMDPATGGPVVDTGLRTSADGIFAAGNLVHPVDTADVAALDGIHAAQRILAFLDGSTPAATTVRLHAQSPLAWVTPGILRTDDPIPARRRLLAWPEAFIARPTIVVQQNDRVIARRRLLWPAAPGRILRIPSSVLDNVHPQGGDVSIGMN